MTILRYALWTAALLWLFVLVASLVREHKEIRETQNRIQPILMDIRKAKIQSLQVVHIRQETQRLVTVLAFLNIILRRH